MIDPMDIPQFNIMITVIGIAVLSWQLSPANLDEKPYCADREEDPPWSCGGCRSMSTYRFAASPVVPCMGIPSFVLILILACWFLVCAWLGQVSTQARDPFRHPRNLLLNTFQMSIFGLIVSLLLDGGSEYNPKDGGVIFIAVPLITSVAMLAIYWNVLLVTAPFPTDVWLQQSQRKAFMFAWINFVILCCSNAAQDSENYGVRKACFQCVYFLFNLVGFGAQLRRSWSVMPPSKRVFIDACKLLASGRLNCNWQPKDGESTAPGFLTAIGVGIQLLQQLLYALNGIMNADLKDIDTCDEMSQPYRGFYRTVTCLSICCQCLNQSTYCVMFADVLIHQLHWTSSTQMALFDSMQGLSWQKYRLRSGAWTEIELLAAGSEGEVHLAEVGVAGGVKQVGLKIPHIDGMEALIQVLDETAIWIMLQEGADLRDPGLKHIVPLVGFCFDVPVVATLLAYCDSGDLLHYLNAMHPSRPNCQALAPLPTRMQLAFEVALAVRTCHRLGIAHLDIKTDNVLLHEGRAYLTDFGQAILHHKDRSSLHKSGHTHWMVPARTGTLAFMAPELYSDGEDPPPSIQCDAPAADVFSFGFLLYECMTLEREPVDRRESTLLSGTLLQQAPTLQSGELQLEGEDSPPQELESLLVKCWQQTPSERPTMDELILTLETYLTGAGRTIAHGHEVQENQIFDSIL